jgi:putative transposase
MHKRRYTFKLYPNTTQRGRMKDLLGAHQCLYNSALSERRLAYEKAGKTLSFYDQCKHVKVLKAELEEYAGVHTHAMQVTLKRLDLAFKAFFRRVKSGEKAGYPRYKSYRRFSGWGYKQHGNGFRVYSEGTHGSLKLSEVGVIPMRGRARQWGKVKTCDIMRKQGAWYASIVVECEVEREHGKDAIGLDWGLEHFLTTVDHKGQSEHIANPRFLNRSLDKLRRTQRALSRKKRGSNRRHAARMVVSRLYGKIARQRREFLHQLSARLVRENALIATEELNVRGMSSAGGAYKKGLNRSILDSSPSMFLDTVQYKAEEAGAVYVEVNTRKVKPSQTCSACGCQKSKTLNERTHACGACGVVLNRDVNAATVMLNVALFDNPTGRELALRGAVPLGTAVKRETPSRTLCV